VVFQWTWGTAPGIRTLRLPAVAPRPGARANSLNTDMPSFPSNQFESQQPHVVHQIGNRSKAASWNDLFKFWLRRIAQAA
jgi:hypothetical protein